MKKLLFILIILIITLVGFIKDPVRELKNNPHLELICSFPDEEKIIPKNKIITYIEEENIWVFVNGYAHDCRIEKIKNTGD